MKATSQFRNGLKKAIAENDKKVLLETLDPVIEKLAKMLLAGVLRKNAVRFLENNKIKGDAAANLVDVAAVRASNWTT